jgi:hypothetical protein
MKEVKGKLPADRVDAFEKGAQGFAKKIVGNFKDYEFVSLHTSSGVQSN